MIPYLTKLPLSLILLSLTFPALAARTDDTFTLRLGAMNADGESTLRGSVEGLERDFYGSRDFDFGSASVSPRVDGVWHISNRNRLIFDYFQYDKDNRQSLGQDISIGDYSIPAGSWLGVDTRFQLASLIYDFSVVETENVSLGLELGAEWAQLQFKGRAEAGDIGSFRETWEENGVAPVVGLRFTATPGERWLINVQGQYLDADWGSFDFSGKIKRANVTAEYRFTSNFGMFVGYDWFEIDYSEPLDSVPANTSARLGIDLEFKGPVAGITLAF